MTKEQLELLLKYIDLRVQSLDGRELNENTKTIPCSYSKF